MIKWFDQVTTETLCIFYHGLMDQLAVDKIMTCMLWICNMASYKETAEVVTAYSMSMITSSPHVATAAGLM